jgi:hypothetical protein
MKINYILSFCFVLLAFVSNSQLNTASIAPLSTSQEVLNQKIDAIDFDMIDLYRAENSDNVIVVKETTGQIFTFVLKSANYCKQAGVPYDESLVNKGKLMGTNPNVSTTYKFDLLGKKAVDVTEY